MKKVRLQSGFEMELPDGALNNMEMVDALAEMESDEDPLAVSRILKAILGEKKRKELYKHLRTEDGYVPVERVVEAVREIFAAYGNSGKN